MMREANGDVAMNRSVRKAFLLPALLAGLAVFAGDGHARQSVSEEERIRSAIEEHTVKSDSLSDINAIPIHLIYRALFIQALLNPDLAGKFSPGDREIINDLPSHMEARFSSFAAKQFSQACEGIFRAYSGSPGLPDTATGIAELFTQAQDRVDQMFARHYGGVIASLSKRGRDVIALEMDNLRLSRAMSHSVVDFIGLGRVEPGFVSESLKASCDKLVSQDGFGPLKEGFLLRDELLEAARDGGVFVVDSSIDERSGN